MELKSSTSTIDLQHSALQTAYSSGALTPTDLVKGQYSAWNSAAGTFVTLASLDTLMSRARELEAMFEDQRGVLYGVPFAVKDNIDVVGFPTTAGCEAFRSQPTSSAPVVDRLLKAGAIMVGKTNMDQFAAGLVGTRTPYGIPKCAFDDRFIPGGSSSGSGSIVGARLVTFALGTDTAGSGRIPAMFNGCVGIKPTLGWWTTQGVVPACRSLDCISVFAQSVVDGALVARVIEDPAPRLDDDTWRSPGHCAALRFGVGASFRFAVPGPQYTSFAGPGGTAVAAGYSALFDEAIVRLERLGGVRVTDFSFSPFAITARMLYETAFIAERYCGIQGFLHRPRDRERHKHTKDRADPNTEAAHGSSGSSSAEDGTLLHTDDVLKDERMQRVTRAIIACACDKSAVGLYGDLDRLRKLKAEARMQMAKVDLLVVPTAAHHYTIEEISSQEEQPDKVSWEYNANLGRFTNFVNLLDMAGIAIPSGLLRYKADAGDKAESSRRNSLAATGDAAPSLPFGVTLLGPAWTDEYLWGIAQQFSAASGLGCGLAGHGLNASVPS